MGGYIRLCCSACAGIKVPSHDPLQNYADVLFSHELLVISPYILSEDLYVKPDAIGLPSEVVQRITFEEQVTDINIKKLQEVVDK